MRFSELYASGEKILSLEFFPPKHPDGLSGTMELVRELSVFLPHFVTITYGAGGGTQQLTRELLRFVNRELRLPVACHLTSIRHTAAEIDAMLEMLEQEGIENVLALRGDRPRDNPNFEPPATALRNARDLVKHIHARPIKKQNFAFSVAVAGYPETHLDAESPEADLAYLREKADAGSEVILTQLFFDPEVYFRFVERARSIGIVVPIVPGIMPIGNLQQIKRFTSMCGASIPEPLLGRLAKLEDKPEAVTELGIEYAVNEVRELLQGGAPGIHLYTLNKSVQVGPIIEQTGLGRSAR